MPRLPIPLFWLCLLGVLALALFGHPAGTASALAAEAGGPHAEGAAAGEPSILSFQPPLSIVTLIVFILLLAVLWRFAWGPLSQALHDREHRMEETLRATEHNRAEAERLLAEHRSLMEQTGEKVRSIMEDARKSAQAVGDEVLQKAQAEAEASRQRAERDIITARDQALKEIWGQTTNLAVELAGRVLEREMTSDDHRRLIAAAVAALPPSPNGDGGLHA